MSDENRNPQHQQMADESMVRTLEAQAQAIWPSEVEIVRRHPIPQGGKVLDVGCGTGEFARRLAGERDDLSVLGVDIIKPHLELARQRCAEFGDRLQFEVGDAYELGYDDDSFDLVVNRHMLQSIPRAEDVIRELCRVAKPGGRIHLLAEDYAMIHFHPVDGDSDRFWLSGPIAFGEATGTDLRNGRRVYSILKSLGATDVWVDYVTVDTLRVPREIFRRIWVAWRDGYTDAIANNTTLTRDEVVRYWEQMIACLDDEDSYAVWQVPVITATVG